MLSALTGTLTLTAARDHDAPDELDRLRAGDPVALDALVRRELPRVERFLVRMLGPRADLADLVQTVFLELCRALPGFRGASTLSTFVGGIAVQVARRTMRPTAWTSRRADLPDDVTSTAAGPEDIASSRRKLARVREVLSGLTPEKRIAFLLWALEGMPIPEIAATMDASVPATRSRIFYAQKELRAAAARDPLLADFAGGDDE